MENSEYFPEDVTVHCRKTKNQRYRALDKREDLMIIFLILIETISLTPHLNHLAEMVQMRGHSMCFYAELTKNIPNYHQILPLI